MMKRTAAALALLITVGCSSTSMTSNETTSNGTTTAKRGGYARDFIVLSTPGYVQEWTLGSGVGAGGFYVRGNKTKNNGFVPIGEVQGNGNFCADGRDWLSLKELRVYTADKGAPVAPYILGCVSGNGFRPASREIVTQ
jgi:hypothetical protein